MSNLSQWVCLLMGTLMLVVWNRLFDDGVLLVVSTNKARLVIFLLGFVCFYGAFT
jgi:hypothetical protein